MDTGEQESVGENSGRLGDGDNGVQVELSVPEAESGGNKYGAVAERVYLTGEEEVVRGREIRLREEGGQGDGQSEWRYEHAHKQARGKLYDAL